jgi:hypothetical protein
MKKVVASFAAFLLVFSVPALFAQMPLGVPVASGISQDLARIGVVAATGGKVELTTPGQVGRIAQSGQAIFLGDEVKTDAQGHLQILLLDETVFTIGPNSAITIDKFVYDPKSQKGEIKASITQGVFRYVSGKIAAKNPDSVKVKLPAASIGFRGTIVGGSVGANGQGLVGLLGPGNNNDTGARTGSFTINGAGGDHQNVNRTGFGVEVGAGGGLSGVFQLSDTQINGLTQGLGGGQGGGGGQQGGGGNSQGALGGNTNMGALSGENKVIAGDNVALVSGLNNVSQVMNNFTTLGAQNSANNSGGGAVPNGTTTYEQLRDETKTGTYHYSGSGTFTQTVGGLTGTLLAQANIIFGPNGSIGSGNSSVKITVSTNTETTVPGSGGGKSFAGGSGPATFNWDDTEGGTGSRFVTTVTLSNSGGVTAQNAVVNVTYTSGGGAGLPGSGSGTASGTLSPGALPPAP